MVLLNGADFADAISDIRASTAAWRLWWLYGFNDVKFRYRRSTLGPLWASLSTGVVICTTAFVFSTLFNTKLDRVLPYICISLILWNLFSTTIMEGAMTFIAAADLILQVKRPLFVYVWQTVWRNLILFAHTLIVFFVVAAIFGYLPNLTTLLVIPGFVLFVANMTWMTAIGAILSTRFRDMPMMINNAFTVLFWLTPVYYERQQTGGAIGHLVLFNPLTHILQVARGPFLLEPPTLLNWAVAVGAAVVGWLLTIMLYSITRKRIAYWL